MNWSRKRRGIGSGTVVALGIVGTGIALLAFGLVVGWDPTWRAVGVSHRCSLMGFERGNLDLLILALVGSAALVYDERRIRHALGAIAFLSAGIAVEIISNVLRLPCSSL
jgi:hypothetical protein